tara:strand:+ start:211 stop:438 length:228 start_codon:yes stop_codon:yes gene_type:complete
MSTQKGFSVGYNAGLDALEICSKSKHAEVNVLAGLMSVVLHATYAMAPFEKAAEELIAFAQQTALEDWIKEKGDE